MIYISCKTGVEPNDWPAYDLFITSQTPFIERTVDLMIEWLKVHNEEVKRMEGLTMEQGNALREYMKLCIPSYRPEYIRSFYELNVVLDPDDTYELRAIKLFIQDAVLTIERIADCCHDIPPINCDICVSKDVVYVYDHSNPLLWSIRKRRAEHRMTAIKEELIAKVFHPDRRSLEWLDIV